MDALHLYGLADAQDSELKWLFVEDATGEPLDRKDRTHRNVAAAWLGRFHSETVGGGHFELPDRGVAHYHRALESARTKILEGRRNPALSDKDHSVLDQIDRVLIEVDESWPAVEERCRVLPTTIVHGDLVRRNSRIQRRNGTARFLIFDWETAGVGPPAADLASTGLRSSPDHLSVYARLVGRTFRSFSMRDARDLARIGLIFRSVAAIGWAASWLKWTDLGHSVSSMASYHARLRRVLREEAI